MGHTYYQGCSTDYATPRKIDHIFVQPADFNVVQAGITTYPSLVRHDSLLFPSDHLPLVTMLEIIP